jgi:hypothetical protein
VLLFKRLRFLFGEQSFGRLDDVCDGAAPFDGNETEDMRALAPIQHVRIPFGLAPIDEGFSGRPARGVDDTWTGSLAISGAGVAPGRTAKALPAAACLNP